MMTIENYIETQRGKEPICAYIYDLGKLKNHAVSLKDSLPSFCRLYYAVKANPDPRLINSLAPIVDGFEVASEGEMRKVPPNRPKLFGAPAKKDREISAALESEVEAINVESLHDLNRIAFSADQKQMNVPVLIRVNLSRDVPESHHMMSGVATQFGVDERDLPLVIEKALELRGVTIEGFHFHAMSNNLDAEAHVRFVNLCMEKAKMWRDRFGLSISTVDIGGGIGINYWKPEEAFDWSVLAKGLHSLKDKAEGLTLVLELGRYMTAECGSYVTEVLDVKKNHDQAFALIRGGTHHLRLPAAWKMSHPFYIHPVEEWDYPYERPEVSHEPVTIAGELCTPNDILVRKEPVERLRAGDVVIFNYAGAYAWTISHHDFLSHPQPEFVYIDNEDRK